MNLTYGLPSALEVSGLTVQIRTGAAFWIWVSARLPRAGEGGAENLLGRAIEGIDRAGQEIEPEELTPQESAALFSRISWFMRGGTDAEQARAGTKSKERTLDYERDLAPLYAAFMQAYGVDLYADEGGKPLIETMHWWRFMALAENLPGGSVLTDYYMYYRGLDVSKLPRKTSADKEHVSRVIEIKRQISLDGKKAPRAVTMPLYVKRAQELKAEKENV